MSDGNVVRATELVLIVHYDIPQPIRSVCGHYVLWSLCQVCCHTHVLNVTDIFGKWLMGSDKNHYVGGTQGGCKFSETNPNIPTSFLVSTKPGAFLLYIC